MIKTNPLYPQSHEGIDTIEELTVAYRNENNKTLQGIIEVNESVADEIKLFFVKALELGFPIHRVERSSTYGWDDRQLTSHNITSAFNYRPIAGTSRLSLHSKGLAIDINPLLNPYIRFNNGSENIDPPGAVYDSTVPGTLYANHPLVIFMKELGWEWGGDWTMESGRIDYQHFQKRLK